MPEQVFPHKNNQQRRLIAFVFFFSFFLWNTSFQLLRSSFVRILHLSIFFIAIHFFGNKGLYFFDIFLI
jgi:hypothetical protein